MFLLGGICFVFLGLINEVLSWQMPLWQQMIIGAIGITILEFVTGFHRKFVARLGCLGLQRDAGQLFGADLSAVLCAVAASGTGRDCPG